MTEKIALNRVETIGTRLGYFGLVPFIFGAISALLSHELDKLLLHAFVFYSVIIISFMAGIQWGLALVKGSRQAVRLLFSVIPPLLGWMCVLTLPHHFLLSILGGVYLLQWFLERPILLELDISTWYREMRPRLAYITAGCHLFIFFRILTLQFVTITV